jgi:hypothetical protein
MENVLHNRLVPNLVSVEWAIAPETDSFGDSNPAPHQERTLILLLLVLLLPSLAGAAEIL